MNKFSKEDAEGVIKRLLTATTLRPGPFANTHIIAFPNGQEMQVTFNANDSHYSFHLLNESKFGRTIVFHSKDFKILHRFKLRRTFDMLVNAQNTQHKLVASSVNDLQRQNALRSIVSEK